MGTGDKTVRDPAIDWGKINRQALAYAMRLTGDKDHAVDLLQEALTRILSKRRNKKEKEIELLNLICGTMKSIRYHERTKIKRQATVSSRKLDPVWITPPGHAGGAATNENARLEDELFLDKLVAFALRQDNDIGCMIQLIIKSVGRITAREIATTLGVPETTIVSYTRRARKMVEAFKQRHPEYADRLTPRLIRARIHP
jgi:DNA-directed RNA polymerase specialized sigma24 family protein